MRALDLLALAAVASAMWVVVVFVMALFSRVVIP